MTWWDALEAILLHLESDPDFLEAAGGAHLYPHGEHAKYQVPGVYWLQYTEQVAENTGPFSVQFDIYANSRDQAHAIEEVIRALHKDRPQVINGVRMWVQMVDARGDATHRDVIGEHRSLDFRIEPARDEATV